MTQSLISVGVFLAFLASLPWVIQWLKRRSGVGIKDVGGQSRIVSAVAVGPHQRVVTVEVGPENARVMLVLGVTAQTITCLHSAPVAFEGAAEPHFLTGHPTVPGCAAGV